MKKTLPLFFLFCAQINAKGQNLVPNGDFEQYSICPGYVNQLDSCLFWTNPSNGSPDYFNQCANPSVIGVPLNFYGYQNAHSGNGYCGIITGNTSPSYNWREYVETELTSPLGVNCYYFEMRVNLSNKSKYSTDTLGVYFSDTLISGINNYYPLPFTPQLTFTGFITDTANWVTLWGYYFSTGGEKFMIIGNFNDSAKTNLLIVNSAGALNYSYLFIDNVCLSLCTNPCNTGMEEYDSNSEIKIYPNPVKDELKINSKNRIEEIKIYDVLGKEMYYHQNPPSDLRLPTSGFKSGIYFIEINDSKNIYRKKFIKE